jgi:hypothetical protein|tara:strand:+ start:699 stop:1220 length:522 start_codon:yes stop_codon:yes gene_type:complete
MAKISNISAYPSIANLDSADYLVITDAENDLMTKTATIGQLQALFGIDTLVAKVTLNNASLLTLGGISATLIAAPGLNKVLDIISVMVYVDAGAVAFDFAGALTLDVGGVNLDTINQTVFNSTTDVVYKPVVDSNLIGVNQPLLLEVAQNPTQGTGVVYLNINYRVLTVGSSF